MKAWEQIKINQFAYRIAKVMKELKSSHIYFIMQEAYEDGVEFDEGYMGWKDCEDIFDQIINSFEKQ